VKTLVEAGHEVIAIDQRQSACGQRGTYVSLDVSQPNQLNPYLSRGSGIFHLAARANVAESVEDPRSNLRTNVAGFVEVLESARRFGCTVIFPSSASIFDPSNTLPLSEKAYARPTSPYAAAKLAGEGYCSAYFQCYGLDVRIARMFSVYGIGMKRFAIYDFVRKIQKNPNQLSILGDGNQIRDYLYVDDATRGLLTILEKGQPGEDYNLASGIPVKLAELARKVAEMMGHAGIQIVTTGKSYPGDVPQWYADITKIKRIGFVPRVALEDGLATTIEWLVGEGDL